VNVKDYPILYVDDDNANRVVMRHNLGSEFTLLVAESGAEALEVLAREPIAVLLADQRMPGMSGVDLAERALQLYPEVFRVIITAYSDLEATIDAINRGRVSRFIKKPWTREELAAVLHESIQSCHNARIIKDLQQRLSQIDRATTIAVMASAIAHDLRQPMAYLELELGVIRNDVASLVRRRSAVTQGSPELAPVVDRLAASVTDMEHGLRKLMVISEAMVASLRNQEAHRARIDLRKVVQSAVTLAQTTVHARAILDVDLPAEEVPLRASEGKLLQLIVNLLLNAAQAIGPGPALNNLVRLQLRSERGGVTLSVDDTGCGIPPERLDQIFVPFFTTKGAQGTGLGLAICKQIVEELAGTISVESTIGRGSRFRVWLPAGEPQAGASTD
jgi:signal transduction histidine kinase